MSSIARLLRLPMKARLGPLEQQLLEELWRRKNATVRELLDSGDTKLAYTTIMTTLDRLYKKQLLDRVPEGRAFRYSPRHTKEELEKVTVAETIRQLLSSGSEAALPLSYLVEAVSEHDIRLLDELQRLLEQKRRQLRDRDLREKEKH